MEVGHIGVSLETTAKFVTALEVWKEQENATIHQTKQHLMASIVEDIIWWWIHALPSIHYGMIFSQGIIWGVTAKKL